MSWTPTSVPSAAGRPRQDELSEFHRLLLSLLVLLVLLLLSLLVLLLGRRVAVTRANSNLARHQRVRQEGPEAR